MRLRRSASRLVRSHSLFKTSLIKSCPAVCDFPAAASRLCSAFRLERNSTKILSGMIRMSQGTSDVTSHVMKVGFAAALSLVTLESAKADDYQLSHNRRISCSRGLAPGKLNTATCKSYTYLFNTKTSEYFRCQVSLALTRDNKEVINVQTDGACTKKPRIFETDGHYDFDATETEPPTSARRRCAAASSSPPASAPTSPNAWT